MRPPLKPMRSWSAATAACSWRAGRCPRAWSAPSSTRGGPAPWPAWAVVAWLGSRRQDLEPRARSGPSSTRGRCAVSRRLAAVGGGLAGGGGSAARMAAHLRAGVGCDRRFLSAPASTRLLGQRLA